jgi:hypothetical protein
MNNQLELAPPQDYFNGTHSSTTNGMQSRKELVGPRPDMQVIEHNNQAAVEFKKKIIARSFCTRDRSFRALQD